MMHCNGVAGLWKGKKLGTVEKTFRGYVIVAFTGAAFSTLSRKSNAVKKMIETLTRNDFNQTVSIVKRIGQTDTC